MLGTFHACGVSTIWHWARGTGSIRSLARRHYENFTVMSWLLPAHLRADVAHLYAYCRTVDDLGDEAGGDRLQLLADWERDLLRCFDSGKPAHPVLQALQQTIRRHNLPQAPFLRLIEANRRDQRQNRYDTWEELYQYCECSANPVGHLYLALFGYADDHLRQLADATCTALQLVNFWQDISRDARQNRIYIPREELQRFGVTEGDVLQARNTAASAELVAHLCRHTQVLFRRGWALADELPYRLGYNIRLFSLGGQAILRRVYHCRHTALSDRPRLSAVDKLGAAARALFPKWGPRGVPAGAEGAAIERELDLPPGENSEDGTEVTLPKE